MAINELSINHDLWLEMLVDNELSADERRQLLDHLASTPEGWKRCALAFINEQILTGDLRASEDGQHGAPQGRRRLMTGASSQNPVKRTSWAFVAVTCLSTLLGVFVGASWQGHPEPTAEHATTIDEADVALASLVKTMADVRERSNRLSTAADGHRETRLFEVIDNEYVSIFDTPDLLPALILESLVLAGHEVEVRPSENAYARSMNRIVVKKTPRTF